MTDDYARRKVQIIKEFLETEFQSPYLVEAVVPRRDPLADTKFKVILNQGCRTNPDCLPCRDHGQLSHPGYPQAGATVTQHHREGESVDGFAHLS